MNMSQWNSPRCRTSNLGLALTLAGELVAHVERLGEEVLLLQHDVFCPPRQQWPGVKSTKKKFQLLHQKQPHGICSTAMFIRPRMGGERGGTNPFATLRSVKWVGRHSQPSTGSRLTSSSALPPTHLSHTNNTMFLDVEADAAQDLDKPKCDQAKATFGGASVRVWDCGAHFCVPVESAEEKTRFSATLTRT